jgi:hypothetical protein
MSFPHRFVNAGREHFIPKYAAAAAMPVADR